MNGKSAVNFIRWGRTFFLGVRIGRPAAQPCPAHAAWRAPAASFARTKNTRPQHAHPRRDWPALGCPGYRIPARDPRSLPADAAVRLSYALSGGAALSSWVYDTLLLVGTLALCYVNHFPSIECKHMTIPSLYPTPPLIPSLRPYLSPIYDPPGTRSCGYLHGLRCGWLHSPQSVHAAHDEQRIRCARLR